jgi:general secretion pathway protein E
VDPGRIGQLLVESRTITPDILAAALTRARQDGRRLGETLVANGAASEESVLRAVAVQHRLPFLAAEELPSTPPALKELSPKYLRQYVACPIAVEGATVTVATADPTNSLLLDELQQSLSLAIKLCVAPGPAILESIERAYGANTALQKIVEGMGPGTDRHAEPEDDVDHLRDMAFEAPVVRLVNLLIDEAVAADASDIHIEPFEDSLRVRYRIDGLLYDQEAPPRRLQAALTSRVKIMAEMNIAERRLPQDGRIRVTAPGGRRVDIRVSTVPTIHGESIVMRLLDRSSVFLPFDRLGFAPATARAFEGLIHRPHGIVLVTGPTGSGKTTTLYAALDKINRPDLKIITVGVTDATGVELFHGKGCDDCRGTGYRGRTGIYELFRITDETRGLIVRKIPAGEIRRHAVAQGMVTLREDAWAKACAGLTTVEEILRVTQEDT